MNLERFVPAPVAASFLGISKRFLLSLARRGIAGSYAIGTGELRKTWVFRLSELSDAIDPKTQRISPAKRPPERESSYDLIQRRSPLK